MFLRNMTFMEKKKDEPRHHSTVVKKRGLKQTNNDGEGKELLPIVQAALLSINTSPIFFPMSVNGLTSGNEMNQGCV